jgi:very-short-patch-repair endonuclease
VTYRTLRGPYWTPVSHGVYAPAGSVDDLAARCAAIRLALPPKAVFSHYTMARLLRLWLPDLPSTLPTFATAPPHGTHIERHGLYVARSRTAAPGPPNRWGLPLAAVTTVLGQLAEDLSLLDLVVAIDSATHARHCSIAELERSIRPRQRGAPMLRRAIRLADSRSESKWETVLRLLHVLAGFQVEPQYRVRDDWGEVIARGDLRLKGLARLHEYDGADHRDRAQHQDDLRRDKSVSRLGWDRYGYTASELAQDPASIVRDAESAYGLPHQPSRLIAWRAEWERSSFSATGARRLDQRLARFTQR